MIRGLLKPALSGILVGLTAGFIWQSFTNRNAEGTENQTVQETNTNGLEKGKPQSKPKSRTLLSPQDRLAIVFDTQQLLNADDYQAVLESLASDAPDLLFEKARGTDSLTSLIAMRCYFSKVEDFGTAVDQLQILRSDPIWAKQLNKLTEEMWGRPDAEKNDKFLATLGALRNSGEDRGNKFGILLRKKSEEDFTSALKFLQKHPEYASESGIIDQVWARENSAEALDYLTEAVSSEEFTAETLRVVGLGIIESKDTQLINQTLDKLAEQEGTPGVANLYAVLARKAMGIGEPTDWVNRVSNMPPGIQKDFLAVDLAKRLKKTDVAPADWITWFQNLGVTEPEQLAKQFR